MNMKINGEVHELKNSNANKTAVISTTQFILSGNRILYGWIELFRTVLQSYQGDGRVIMGSCLQ